ncbi:SCY1-like protein 2 [Halotydeus destructor]|nr:SCY1-like protein 2 [Halotydeus destructor]
MSQLMSLLNSFESSSPSVQCNTLRSIGQLIEILDEDTMVDKVLPKISLVIENNFDIEVQEQALKCLEKAVDYLPKNQILGHVLPLLSRTRLEEPLILMAVARIYEHMLSDKNHYGLTSSILATKVMPIMTPYIVSPYLSSKEFTALSKLLQDMLNDVTQGHCSRTRSKAEKINSLDLTRMGSHLFQCRPLVKMAREGTARAASGPLDGQSGPGETVTKLMRAISPDTSADEEDDDDDDGDDATSHLQVAEARGRRHSDNAISIAKTLSAANSPVCSRAPSPTLIARARSSSNLMPASNRRRHSSVNPHDIQRFANKMLDSAAESVVEGVEKASKATKGMHFGLDTMAVVSSLAPSPAGSRRGSRRCSVADFIHAAQSGTLLSQKPEKKKKCKGPKKLFKKIGTEMNNLLK